MVWFVVVQEKNKVGVNTRQVSASHSKYEVLQHNFLYKILRYVHPYLSVTEFLSNILTYTIISEVMCDWCYGVGEYFGGLWRRQAKIKYSICSYQCHIRYGAYWASKYYGCGSFLQLAVRVLVCRLGIAMLPCQAQPLSWRNWTTTKLHKKEVEFGSYLDSVHNRVCPLSTLCQFRVWEQLLDQL